ncbi:MAG: extracellular solute-binding protein [Clostridia bacterium]|nr:extracellular solute-binding protein [Clostridia bacterium]
MKKLISLALALAMVLSLVAVSASAQDYSGYTIRIYSNSNSIERVTYLKEEAAKAGFSISIDDNSVLNGDTAAVQAANENKDADLIFGLNETRWGQLIGGTYENIKIADWTPSWADKVGTFKYEGKAYGLVIQNILMLYRNDEYGTNGVELHFEHWADVVNSGYTWYRQGKVGGTTNANINNAILYPFADPTSPAGGITVEGWKTLWAYCANGNFTGDSYGIDPLIRGDVQVSTMYSSSLYSKIESGADISEHPLKGILEPENWSLVDIADGTYYIAEYIGVVEREGRTEAETEAVKAFAEWFGSADVQRAWSDEFDSYPCNEDAVEEVYPIYTIPSFTLNIVPGTELTYAAYVAAHSAEWTNIMTNLGFYWADQSQAKAEPDWDNLDWAVLTQKAE